MAPAHRELWELARLLHRSGPRRRLQPGQLRRVREGIARARQEVASVLEEEGL